MVDLSRAPARAGTDRPAAIRTALRRCDYRRALSLLRGVTEMPDGAPPPGEIAAYAQERLSRLHKRSRTTTLDRDALQHVLVWLTADELRDGEQALTGEHLNRAITSFERALRIDGRGSRAALLLAMALYRSVTRELSTHDEPELDRTYDDLDQALELLDRAALDAPLRPRAAELASAVERQRQILARLRRRRGRSRALDEYLTRYNAFMTRYHGGRMMTSARCAASTRPSPPRGASWPRCPRPSATCRPSSATSSKCAPVDQRADARSRPNRWQMRVSVLVGCDERGRSSTS